MQQTNDDKLLSLFSLHGNIVRIMVCYNKSDHALVEMADGFQSELVESWSAPSRGPLSLLRSKAAAWPGTDLLNNSCCLETCSLTISVAIKISISLSDDDEQMLVL